jgi:NADH dehydrogenase
MPDTSNRPDSESPAATQPQLVIIGGGFAGLAAARGLRTSPLRITLVDRCNHHLFQPLLYQVATAGLAAPAIAAPLRHMLRRQRNVAVLMAQVERIDANARRLQLDVGTLDYDLLLVASGATHAYFGHDDWAAHAPGLKTLDDALLIRRRVLSAFEQAEREPDPVRRRAWLSFAVVGAGPTGVELAGTLAEIARHTLRDQFRRIDPTQARVLLLEAGAQVLNGFPDDLSASARAQLERLGVEVRTGVPVTAIDAGGVVLGDQRIECRTVLWAAGVAASPLGAQLGAALDRSGRVLVAPDLSVPGHPEVFVAGDLAAVRHDNKPVPGVAPAAKQMGAHVARQIRRRLAGIGGSEPFRYRDQGALATIGRKAAVARFGRLHLRGLPAWWAWLLVHVLFLIGFRNKLVVLLDWAWAYLTYQRHARIITGADTPPSAAADDPPRPPGAPDP